jgi:hypothetical protein
MRKLTILYTLAFLLCQIISCSGFSGLDYTIGGSTNGKGKAQISKDDSIHGPHSLKLSVIPEKGRYARVYANFDRPMPIEELDQLSLSIKPVNGEGKVTLDIYLDSGSKLSTSKSWSSGELGTWQQIDAFDLYFDKKSLADCQKDLKGQGIKKIWIRLYNNGSEQATAYLDYLKIRDKVISFEPLEKEDLLDAPTSASAGEKITYTITYGNEQLVPIDFVVVNQYDPGVLFLEADPAPDPGTNDVWTFKQLPPGEYRQIKITVRTHKLACEAEISGSVFGNGLASVARTLSTDQPGYQVNNLVTLSTGKSAIGASATTNVKPLSGSISSFSEHGSGFYSSDEMLSFSPSRISIKQDLMANGSFALVNVSGHLLRYNSSWHVNHICENRITKGVISERYLQANVLNLGSTAGIQKKKTWMETDSNFSGIAQYDFRGPIRSINEMLVGSFTARNREIEWQNSSSKYADKSWLNCPLDECDPNVQENLSDQED